MATIPPQKDQPCLLPCIRYAKRDPEKGLVRGRVREVKGIDQNTNLNKALWHLAERLGEAFAV
jgi:hypothetical protein